MNCARSGPFARCALASLILLLARPIVAQEMAPEGSGEPSPADVDVVAVVAEAEDAHDRSDAAERFRWYGEELYYSVSMFNAEVVRAVIAIGHPTETEAYGRVVPMQINATTVGFFDAVYPIENRGLSWVDGETFLPVRTIYEYNERDYVSTNDVRWRHDEYVAPTTREDSEGTLVREIVRVTSDTFDELSVFMDLRSRDLSVGKQYVYYEYDGIRLERFIATVERHEDVYTELGFIPAAAISFTLERLDAEHPLPWVADTTALPPTLRVNEGPRQIAVGYFSLDHRRLPLGTDVHTDIGDLQIRIDRVVPPNQAGR